MKFITIGSDPEFFVHDPKGKPYPATLFAKGTKDRPVCIKDGFFEQRDNLSFEGNVPPATSKKEFICNVSYLREYFSKKVEKFGYSLSPNGVEYFDNRYLRTPEGMEFGCSSVISSWDSSYDNRSIVERPTPNLNGHKFRVAGFHIHIGYTLSPEKMSLMSKSYWDILIGRLFDVFLTIPSQEIWPEEERITTYGKYGMIRTPDYGVECRTLSTYFTQESWLPWVWDQIMKIEKFINKCSHKDLLCIISRAYYTGSNNNSIRRNVLTPIFCKFSQKHILKKFDETKHLLYEDKKSNTGNTTAGWSDYYTIGTDTAWKW